jgi:transposase
VSVNERIVEVVLTSATTVTNVHGVGALGAAIIVGHTGNIARFPDAGHSARYNGTAPIEASSALKNRHRLNPRGNRQLNCALHVAAITQVAHDTDGRLYYQRKLAENKTRKEVLRALKRHQQRRLPPTRRRHAPLNSGPGRADGTTLNRVTDSAP